MTSKKNWTLRAAVLMLALVLITSCFVGGTFAKYVTSGTGGDHARVAKWGVTVAAHGTGDIFAQSYDNTVISETKDNVVAPGTKKDNATLVTLSGQPEVAVNVTYSAEDFGLVGNWVGNASNEFYCPLIIKVTHKENDTDKTETIYCAKMKSAEEVKTAVKNAVAACSANYEAKTNLSTVENGGVKISWEWPFDGNANPGQNDDKDTYLGNQAVTADLVPSIYIMVTATVTQID